MPDNFYSGNNLEVERVRSTCEIRASNSNRTIYINFIEVLYIKYDFV